MIERGGRVAGLVLWLLVCSLAPGGCGRLMPRPSPTAVADVPRTAVPTATRPPTATRRATFTPVPATPSNTPTPTITPTPLIYSIKKGDTLLAVARRFGLSVAEIQNANGIEDPRRLRVGQEIIIPARDDEGEPTKVPTPTPVALRIQGVEFYRTPTGSLWCLGEVLNLSGEPAEEVEVQVSLHDEQGQMVAWGAAFTPLDVLPIGGRSPFAVQFDAPPAQFAQYQARVLSGVPSRHLGPRYPSLAVVDDAGAWLDATTYQVRGQVQNTGQADAQQVTLVVTLYDDERHVVGGRTVEIAAELFLAGAIAPFEVTITPMGGVGSYDVQVQGWWVGYEAPAVTDTAAP